MTQAKLTSSVGCDLVYVPRLERMLRRTPTMRQKCFSPQEQQKTSFHSLAGIFAAKEAIIKSLNLKLADISRLEITSQPSGAPIATIDHQPAPVAISISHDGDYAFAIAISKSCK